jgi:hypothetical protein
MLLLLAASAQGAARYGDATLRAGKMTVLREGRRLVFEADGQLVPIMRQDVIRVGPASSVLLKTVEKSTLTLGANAVFHVKPWEQSGKRGLLRMLYGRFRATITGLTRGERFNVRTATATIGVKGTGYTGGAPPQGDALVFVHKKIVQLAGPAGGERDVRQGFVSVVINGKPAKPPVRAPARFLTALKKDGLDSPPPNSPAALGLPGEQALIAAGIISKEEADASRRGGAGLDPDTGAAPGATTEPGAESQKAAEEAAAAILPMPDIPQAVEDALEAIEQTVEDSVNESSAPKAPLRLRFEN